MTDDFSSRVARGEAFVYTAGGETVGLIVLVTKTDRLLIENVAVGPLHQSLDFGRGLLDYGERRTRECSFAKIRLYTNALMHENIARYRDRGYVETHRASDAPFARVYFRKML